MLVSLKEINKYVSLEGLDANGIAKALTFSGTEVEEVTPLASGTNLIIGEVIFCQDHPDSDHLHVLKVNLGPKYGEEQIVCGAPNARKGLKVIVARVGAILPKIEIKKGVIRGVESNGMCCSLLELGVDNKYLSEYQTKGIEELPNDAPVGEEDVLGYLGLDDTILNLNVLANRPDLLSIYNVAREVGAIFARPVSIPTFEHKADFKTELKVGSETPSCSQFSGCEIRGIVTKPSPKYISEFLMAEGVRSINNIVDIGNYVMLLTGQPLHMYDADKLAKKELIAKSNYQGGFVALDENNYDLIEGDIVITTDNKPMCLGGVMGSLECAVDESTKNIYIEAASFDGASIRHTSTRLGLVSESSQRFVKGTNHFQAEQVIALASKLCCELCEATAVSDIVTYQSEEYKEQVVETTVNKINARLATSFSKEQIVDVLTRLQFVVKEEGDKLLVKVPSFRLDISGNADISEEVIRLLGYDNVDMKLPVLPTTVGGLTLKQNRQKLIRDYLLSSGLCEALTYSLVNKNEVNCFNLLHNEEAYQLLNPLMEDREMFRTHILHSLLESVSYNVARQAKNIPLFEVSEMISKKSQTTHLAIALCGVNSKQGLLKEEPYDFYHMKGLVENLFSLLGVENSRYRFDVNKLQGELLHPGRSVEIYFQNQLIGRFGELHPRAKDRYELGKNAVVVLEMNISPLLEAKVSQIKMAEISKYPSVSRDLALLIDVNINSGDVIKMVKMSGKGIVTNVEVFDVYYGAPVSLLGKKSLAIRITYASKDHTLQEKEITLVEDQIKFDLAKNFKAELRG